jgi:WD40 repeat protein
VPWPWFVSGAGQATIGGGLILLAIILALALAWAGAPGKWHHAAANPPVAPPVRPVVPPPPINPPVDRPFEPAAPIVAKLSDDVYRDAGRITSNDRVMPNQRGKRYIVPMTEGHTYRIDLSTRDFHPTVGVETDLGARTARNDEPVIKPVRLVFGAHRTDRYHVIVSSTDLQGQGAYELTITEEFGSPIETVPKLPDLTLPESTTPGTHLAGSAEAIRGGGSATAIRLDGDELVGELCWSNDPTAFFTLDRRGVLRRIRLDGFVEERRLDLARRCGWLAVSQEGLVVTLLDLQEAWVIDPGTLQVRKRVAAPSAARVVASPQTSIAVAANGQQGGPLTVLDLAKGQPLRQYNFSTVHAAMSPDGKYLFSQGWMEEMYRFRLSNSKLSLEETGHRIASNGQRINLSPDSKYVCLPSGGGNGTVPGGPPAGGYSTHIYPVDDIRRPAFILESGPYPRVVGFDPKAGLVFTQNFSNHLLVYSYAGLKQREMSFHRANREEPQQYLAHPAGKKLLVRFPKGVVCVDLTAADLSRPGVEDKPDSNLPPRTNPASPALPPGLPPLGREWDQFLKTKPPDPPALPAGLPTLLTTPVTVTIAAAAGDVPVVKATQARILAPTIRVQCCVLTLPDNERCLVPSGGRVEVWNYRSGKREKTISSPGTQILNTALSSDGSTLVIACAENRATSLFAWDLVKDRELWHTTPVKEMWPDLVLSPSGESVLLRTSQLSRDFPVLRLYSAKSGELSKTLPSEQGNRILQAAFHPDGRRVLLARGPVISPRTATIWDPNTGKEAPLLNPQLREETLPMQAWLLSPTGGRLFFRVHQTAAMIDLEKPSVLWKVQIETITLRGSAFSKDGRCLMTFGGARRMPKTKDPFVHILDARTGKEICRLEGEDEFQAAAFTPDRKGVIAISSGLAYWPLPE